MLGLVQMSCAESKQENVEKAVARIGDAAEQGANVVCLQELFHGRYPCQSEDYARFAEAEPIRARPAGRWPTRRDDTSWS
jgi:N-carbamoylputrescine amidase